MISRWHLARWHVFVLGAFLLAGCSDEPTVDNALTSDLPLKGFASYDTTIIADTNTTFRKYVPMNGMTNMLGIADG